MCDASFVDAIELLDDPRGLLRQIRHGHLGNLAYDCSGSSGSFLRTQQTRSRAGGDRIFVCVNPSPRVGKLPARQRVFEKVPEQRRDLIGHRAHCHDVAQSRIRVKATATSKAPEKGPLRFQVMIDRGVERLSPSGSGVAAGPGHHHRYRGLGDTHAIVALGLRQGRRHIIDG